MTIHTTAFASDPTEEISPPPRRKRPIRWVGLLGAFEPSLRRAKESFFVSYARRDQARVRRILNEGRAAGHQFWLDRTDIPPGGKWPGAVVAAIRASRGAVVFCSPAAYGSDHVLREIALAARYKKPLLPVILEGDRGPDAFLYYLSIHQSIDVAADPAWRIHFLEALEGLAQGRSRLN